jgi:predicted ribosome quality control (RQC) complex YloA/Tae2 family protein
MSHSSLIQPLDAITLWHLAQLWTGNSVSLTLLGAKVNRIQQFGKGSIAFGAVLLQLWQHGLVHKLLLWASPNGCMVSLLDDVTPLTPIDKPKNEPPSGFCMLLRKYLMGATLQSITVPKGERLLHLTFKQQNDSGDWQSVILTAELLGKASNLLLRTVSRHQDDSDSNILGLAFKITAGPNAYRDLTPGVSYMPPQPRVGQEVFDALQISPDVFCDWLILSPANTWISAISERFCGLGQDLLRHSLADCLNTKVNMPNKTALGVYQQLCCLTKASTPLQPSISPCFTRFGLLPSQHTATWQTYDTVSTMQQAWIAHQLQRQQHDHLRQQLQQSLSSKTNKLQRKAMAFSSSQTASGNHTSIADWIQQGNVLLAIANSPNSGSYPKQTPVLVSPSQSINVALNQTWIQNAQACFKLAKKAKSREQQHAQLLTPLTDQLTYFAVLQSLLNQAETWEDLLALRADWLHHGLIALGTIPASNIMVKAGRGKSCNNKPVKGRMKSKSNTATPLADPMTGIMQYTASDQTCRLLVGKSALANERLSGSLGRGDDFWLHAQGVAGSHVLVKPLVKTSTLSDQTLLEATHLAAWFSDARHAIKVPVVCTKHRFVRKVPNSYPGHVSYSNEDSILIEVQPLLLASLGISI